MANGRVIRFEFDSRRSWGSSQHYFHYMWGYLMPALGMILEEQDRGSSFWFESCGPLMDGKTRELCEWLQVPFRIGIEGERPTDPEAVDPRLVPRWDLWFRERWRVRVPLTMRLRRRGLRVPILDDIDRVVRFLHRRAGCPGDDVIDACASTHSWLLLRRSEEPSFYRLDGAATKPGYGVGRRAIANFEALAADLERSGLPVQIYEPGQDSLPNQIRRFAGAAGIIAIRGAEFANLAWMRPGSTALMLLTPVRRENNAAENLATSRGIRFRTLPVRSEYPVVEASRVLGLLESHNWRSDASE